MSASNIKSLSFRNSFQFFFSLGFLRNQDCNISLTVSVVCARIVGSLWTTCSFIVCILIAYGPLCFVCLVYLGCCHSMGWSCWCVGGGFGSHRAAIIWGAIPLCLWWILWSKHNHQTFEGEEHSLVDLKRFFLLSLYYWMKEMSSPSASSFEEF